MNRRNLISAATEVLGSREKAMRWANKPCRALGGVSPLKTLKTPGGSERLELTLGQIKYGIYP